MSTRSKPWLGERASSSRAAAIASAPFPTCTTRMPEFSTTVRASSALMSLSGGLLGFRPHLRFHHVPDRGGDVRSAELRHLPDSGRRGDVDLGEIVADHVDADED